MLTSDEKILESRIELKFKELLQKREIEIMELNAKAQKQTEDLSLIQRQNEEKCKQIEKEKVRRNKCERHSEVMFAMQERLISDLEERVYCTVLAKNQSINALQEQVEDLKIHNLHFEKLLERQRMVGFVERN